MNNDGKSIITAQIDMNLMSYDHGVTAVKEVQDDDDDEQIITGAETPQQKWGGGGGGGLVAHTTMY